jgi:hypothetical protein
VRCVTRSRRARGASTGVERDWLERIGNEVASDVMLPDGTPIDDETVAHVRQAVADETVAVR